MGFDLSNEGKPWSVALDGIGAPGQNVRTWDVEGANLAVVGDGVPHYISSGGDIIIPTVATAMQLVSGNAADDIVGTAAQKVTVHGLRAAFVEDVVEFDMDGVTPVAIGDWLRINRLEVTQAGTGGVNAGIIDCEVSGGGNNFAAILVDTGIAQLGLFTVPANHKALLLSEDYNGTQSCEFQRWKIGGGVQQVKRSWPNAVSHFQHYRRYQVPKPFDAGTDIALLVKFTGSASAFSAHLELLLFRSDL